jgi:hypothetical protein
VLFLYFEDMKKDLPSIVRQVAAFLDVAPLSDAEVAAVVHKSSFKYMQEHESSFEMVPPHLLQKGTRFFISGSVERHKDVPEDVRLRVMRWAAREMKAAGFPLEQAYPDVAASGG